MNERETAEAIADRAAEWVARIDAAGDDPDMHAALEAWLAGDVRRRGAYFRAQAAWVSLDRAQVLACGQGEHEAAPARRRHTRTGLMWGGGIAAAAAMLYMLGPLPAPAERIETAIGEIRRVPLKDGSIAAVNTSTRLAVRIEEDGRRVRLDEGEAWFQVAHDPAAPFTVEAGSVRVRAVGTAFSVRRVPGGAQVHVTEGRVETWLAGSEALRQRVPAGASAFIDEASATPPRIVADEGGAERQLAWRSGQLIFSGDTLADAAAEFNRYNKVKVRIADPQLAGERFVGRFRTNEPDAFAHAAATINGARIRTGNDEIVLLGQ